MEFETKENDEVKETTVRLSCDKVVVERSGDRFADVVEDVRLKDALDRVIFFVTDMAENAGRGDVEVHNCLKVLSSMQANTATAIGDAIE